ncbi:MAG TPA: hypothetical protein ENJ82_09050, partial [Bacteroidetes bacterium]|nr:hypothetical protein [Bacteroidota bacterium]
MREFDNSYTRHGSRDWDASKMPGLMPPDFALRTDGGHELSTESSPLSFGNKTTHWDVTTHLNISATDRKKDFSFEIEDGKPFVIDASKGLDLGTKTGNVSFVSNSVLKPELDSSVTQSSQIAEQFEYKMDEQGNYVLGQKASGPERIDLSGPWFLKNHVTQAGPERIRRELELHKDKTLVDDSHLELSSSKSTTKIGGDLGSSGSGSMKNKLHVELDGNDVLLLLGGAEMRLTREAALGNEVLDRVLGGFETLLQKQSVSVDVETQLAGTLAASCGYHY